MANPVVRHGSVIVSAKGKNIPVRILLVKYNGAIEVYFQSEGYPYEFAYGLPDHVGFKDVMEMAIANAAVWGVHYDYI